MTLAELEAKAVELSRKTGSYSGARATLIALHGVPTK